MWLGKEWFWLFNPFVMLKKHSESIEHELMKVSMYIYLYFLLNQEITFGFREKWNKSVIWMSINYILPMISHETRHRYTETKMIKRPPIFSFFKLHIDNLRLAAVAWRFSFWYMEYHWGASFICVYGSVNEKNCF